MSSSADGFRFGMGILRALLLAIFVTSVLMCVGLRELRDLGLEEPVEARP